MRVIVRSGELVREGTVTTPWYQLPRLHEQFQYALLASGTDLSTHVAGSADGRLPVLYPNVPAHVSGVDGDAAELEVTQHDNALTTVFILYLRLMVRNHFYAVHFQ